MDARDLKRSLVAKEPCTEIARQQQGLLRSIVAYEPTPIPRPTVDGGFGEMSMVESALEAFRYSAFLLEYTLSPNGWLRAWLVLWCRMFLLLVIPTVAATVAMRLAVPLAANLAEALLKMEIAARAGTLALGWLVLAGGLIASTVTAVRWFLDGRR